ncbi:thioesterase II family protein [Streptomyces sp. H27-D2]|uniref:thioesterase II family protein n=1 Tax=Streptomyces sp. H27-D2 TaxID=3046304 RepID=UPI002DBF4647|nr:alpha/beta fold hydrolase [Streptomyces sp. H27-D2]MEC4020917.1 alpha/beta fold hydrolase [Streptomyces sp. H27-D2]
MNTPAPARRPAPPRWITRTDPRPDARLTLYCLPHAGGGASAYRNWSAGLPAWVEVAAVQLPGRENRIADEALVDPAAVAAAITADRDGRPYALFGHSMGGVLAFELARLLSGGGRVGPVRLGISGVAHPLLRAARLPLSGLPDEELLDWVRALGGAPEWALSDPQFHELLLTPLRADLAWLEGHVHQAAAPLTCPVSVFAGEDDEHAQPAGIDSWREETSAGCSVRRYPGGHFYLDAQLPALLRDLAEDLSERAEGRPGDMSVHAEDLAEGRPGDISVHAEDLSAHAGKLSAQAGELSARAEELSTSADHTPPRR